jgi:hypothetical protein
VVEGPGLPAWSRLLRSWVAEYPILRVKRSVPPAGRRTLAVRRALVLADFACSCAALIALAFSTGSLPTVEEERIWRGGKCSRGRHGCWRSSPCKPLEDREFCGVESS